jgi:hypothetical protein
MSNEPSTTVRAMGISLTFPVDWLYLLLKLHTDGEDSDFLTSSNFADCCENHF